MLRGRTGRLFGRDDYISKKEKKKMDFLMEKIRWFMEFIFVHPKSVESLLFFLAIIFIIAFIVNRHRDDSGRVSFLDRSKTGVTGICIYSVIEGQRTKNRIIPLWIPEKNLLLKIKLFLPKGDYEIKAFWKEESSDLVNQNIFEAIPVDAGSFSSISRVSRFKLNKHMNLGFNLAASDKQIQIDCPEKEVPGFEPVDIPFPLTIPDSSYKKFAVRFEKERDKKILELSILDDRIITALESQNKLMHRKLEQAAIRYKKNESDMNQLMEKYKKLHQSVGAKKE